LTKSYLIADLFCGAGGSSTGAERAVKSLGATMILTCVNHWPLAIETHRRNHPTARHYIEDISKAKPRDLVPEGYLDLLMASPECTHFSRARGGKPVNDQSRMNPWAVVSWLTELDVRCLLVENVPEFVNWGPVGNGIPDKPMQGIFFEAWLKAIKTLGYRYQYRYLNAADYGDATTRRRFFLIARKDGQRIRWPKPTHSKDGGGGLKRWRAAREIIDWDLPGRSLLDDPKYVKRPLSINTRRRIARGLEKYGGVYAPYYIQLLGIETIEGENPPQSPFYKGGGAKVQGFTIANRNHATPRGMEEPVNTVVASNAGGGLCRVEPVVEPFVLGQQSCSAARDAGQPIPTVAQAGAISLVDPQIVVFHGRSTTQEIDRPLPSQPTHSKAGLVEPQLVSYYGNNHSSQPVDNPAPTITSKDRHGLIEFIVDRNHPGDGDRTRSVDDVLNTITTHHTTPTLIEPTAEPFIVQPRLYGREKNGGPVRAPHAINEPAPAVTGHGAGALVETVIIQTDQSGRPGKISDTSVPVGTIVTKQSHGLAEPIVVPYGPRAEARAAGDPLPTVMTKDRLGLFEPVLADVDGREIDPRRLVVVDGELRMLDIRFRMLNNHELARAMGFDDAETEYEFMGTVAEVTKQIGNAVPVNMAAALVTAILEERA